MRDMALDHPDMKAAFPDTLENAAAARFSQTLERAMDFLHGGRLQGDDRSHVVHDTRIAEHALDA